jgi:hypothetical protein
VNYHALGQFTIGCIAGSSSVRTAANQGFDDCYR